LEVEAPAANLGEKHLIRSRRERLGNQIGRFRGTEKGAVPGGR
jgi:hypothetical protein